MSQSLQQAVHKLVMEFRLKTTFEPNMLLVPKRRDFVKSFAEALSAEIPEAGNAPFVFDQLWRVGRECTYDCAGATLMVVVSDADNDLAVDRDISQDVNSLH